MRTQKFHYHSRGILRGRFNPMLLPDPHAVLCRLGILYGYTNDHGYWTLHCPFHDTSKNLRPTLQLHHIDGHYFCRTCTAKGKNILGFYMASTGKDFIKASTTLKAWEICR